MWVRFLLFYRTLKLKQVGYHIIIPKSARDFTLYVTKKNYFLEKSQNLSTNHANSKSKGHKSAHLEEFR